MRQQPTIEILRREHAEELERQQQRGRTYRHVCSSYFAAVRNGKPRLAADALNSAIFNGTAAEVADFIREVQISQGKQDVDLLPDTQWKLDAETSTGFDNSPSAEHTEINTAQLCELLSGKTTWNIDWPSVTSHWGVAVFFAIHDVKFRAFSKDWALTDTYRQS